MPQLELFSSKNDDEIVEMKQSSASLIINSEAMAENEQIKTEKTVVELAEESLLSRRLAIVRDEESADRSEMPSPAANNVIFADEKISVRIKKRKSNDSVEKKNSAKTIKLPQKRGRKPLKDIESEVDLIEVPDDEDLFKKQYYAISEVAKWFRVNTSLIRFWENEFDILKPKKNRKGDRLFRPEDVKNIHLIYHLLRQRKYSIEGAKEFLKSHKGQVDIHLKLTQSLQKLKAFLLELKANLQA